MFNQILMTVIGVGALLGGLDKIFHNRFHLGEKFDEGFQLLGPMALSMSGIIVLTPLLSKAMSLFIRPLFTSLGIDPAMAGCILAIDMGGYSLSMDLAVDPLIGAFSGIIASAMFGCTLVFTIPVGMSVLEQDDRPLFLKGILAGLICLPIGLIVGGCAMGIPLPVVFFQSIPVFLLSLFLLGGLVKFPQKTVHGFSLFARLIQIMAVAGLSLSAFQHISGIVLIDSLTPLPEAMEVVCSIGIVMLGSLPIAELLRRALSVPFAWIGRKTGLNDSSTTGLIVGSITVMPALVMVKDMDRRGKVLCGAFLVCGASAIGAHMGFAAGTQPQLIMPLLAGKATGALCAMILAMYMTKS
ncbi:MAG: ethanolamine utilization protein EutH [Bulleidia sp.]